ncbi:hypothetical protein [Maritalea porphyrae]|uniref:hypothetical protein n=1 Tax=Maritalea porphyrae TaxID=880732 RepID=UPI0022AFF211|nr:hypothetical protein [Maritalea porphyrae]MCZ4273222.1 hypothetical protein [Maritalea porphyrae]
MIRSAVSAVLSSVISMTAVFILMLVGFDAGWRQYSAMVPAEDWLSIGDIHVSDSYEGVCPSMTVDRDIRQDFFANWRVEAERKVGALYVFRRIANGSNSYSTDAVLPPNLDLGWWTLDVFCNKDGKIMLPSGVYRINTTWIIEPAHFPPKRVSINSNDFTVY